MTIPSGSSYKNVHIGNGVASVFDYDFKITNEADLLVTITDTNGVATTQTFPTDYTVSGVGNDAGGQITLVAGALTSGYDLVIEDNVALSQEQPFGNQSIFFGINHENAFDKVTRLVRRALEQIGTALRLPSNITGVSTTLPEPKSLNLMRWNSSANGLENVAPADIGTTLATSNWIVDTFTAGIDFTPTVTTQITLTASPGVIQNTWVFFDAAPQHQDQYTLSANVITFNSAVPSGVAKIEVRQNEALAQSVSAAASTTYSPGFVGAVNTTVQDKFREYVTLTDVATDGGGVAIDSTKIQAAIDSLTPGIANGGVVYGVPGKTYNLGTTGLIVPAGVRLDMRGATLNYSGTGFAVTLGTSDTVLDYYPELVNFQLVLKDKDADGVRLRGCSNARVYGYIEGPTSDYATRTNRGVVIDGVNASGFFNHIEVLCNHVHESFVVTTTGTIQPTQQYFVNCSAVGDEQAGDTSSIAFKFDSSKAQTGQGTIMIGCNAEDVATGWYVGANAGHATILGGRVELTAGPGTWKIDFIDGCDPWTIVGLQGLGSTYMESNSGIRNFDSNKHILLGTDDGTLRLGGFDKALNAVNFIGLGGAVPQIWFDNNADMAMLLDSDNSGTGRMVCQAGSGSADRGAGWIAHSPSHGTNPGDLFLYPSSDVGGVWAKRSIDGPTMGGWSRINGLAGGETNMYLVDGNTATVQQVKCGANNSGPGGTGRALYIDNF